MIETTGITGGGQRDNNYDYMRVFAMMMVILNHIADYFMAVYETGTNIWKHTGYTYLFESISHCAIPLFLMLTGVYVIDKAGKMPARVFYKASIKKLGLPFLLFVIIYYGYDICITKSRTVDALYQGIITGFCGMYAHWYMVMLAVVYAFIPLLAFIKNRVSKASWIKGVIVFFIWVMLGHYYESSLATWSLSNMYLIGYVLIGNVIHQKLSTFRKNNFLGLVFISGGILILALNGVILNYIVMSGGNYYNKLFNLYGAPLIIIGSMVIFSGFTLLSVRYSMKLLSNISYLVFLSHKLLIDIIADSVYPILEKMFNYDIRVLIAVEYIIVFPLAICFGLLIFNLLNRTFYRRS